LPATPPRLRQSIDPYLLAIIRPPPFNLESSPSMRKTSDSELVNVIFQKELFDVSITLIHNSFSYFSLLPSILSFKLVVT
jgi:hypothetical protein